MRTRLARLAAAAAALPAIGLAAPAVAVNANGNNGDIKVAEVDQPGTESNDPHVGCTFAVEWYNFDAAAVSTVGFEAQAPTGDAAPQVVSGATRVTLENDAAKGADDYDGRQVYTLSFSGDPQPNQGYHVKVTAETTGSNGNDTKTKTFWVGPCTPATDPGTPGDTGDTGGDDAGTTPAPTDPGTPFDWDWTYDAPTCTALTVDYPADIPAGQANDVNVRLDTDQGQVTLNFHHNTGTWSGEKSFVFADHPGWPSGVAAYHVRWVQVAGTNYHWQGDVSCVTDGDPSTPDVPQAVTEVSGFRAGTMSVRRGTTVAADVVGVAQADAALTLERHTAAGWSVAGTVATDARGTARVSYPRFTRRGTYKYRLTVSGSIDTTGAATRPLTVKVR